MGTAIGTFSAAGNVRHPSLPLPLAISELIVVVNWYGPNVNPKAREGGTTIEIL
jgi:hypothetical protein